MVRNKSEDFYEALKTGKRLRAVMNWLQEPLIDSICERLKCWMEAEGMLLRYDNLFTS